jgi:hypothetical protein
MLFDIALLKAKQGRKPFLSWTYYSLKVELPLLAARFNACVASTG